jgi:hypothetical protein
MRKASKTRRLLEKGGFSLPPPSPPQPTRASQRNTMTPNPAPGGPAQPRSAPHPPWVMTTRSMSDATARSFWGLSSAGGGGGGGGGGGTTNVEATTTTHGEGGCPKAANDGSSGDNCGQRSSTRRRVLFGGCHRPGADAATVVVASTPRHREARLPDGGRILHF